MSAAPRPTSGARRVWALVLLLATLVAVAVTVALFPRAYPLADPGLSLDRAGAIARAEALAARERLAPAGARTAATFVTDDSLSTYVDLAAGGPDAVRALARDREVPLFRWAVRLYRPGDVHEAMVRFAPDGRPIGLARTLPEDERRPTVALDVGRAAADLALGRWTGAPAGAWRFTDTSYVTQPKSGRVDRTYRYERVGRRIGEAPIRAAVTVTGAAPAAADSARGAAVRAELLAVRSYVDIPEAWARTYAERRSANDNLALYATPGVIVFAFAGLVALVRMRRDGTLRWRPAMLVGALVGVLMLAAGLNDLPLAWIGYDTATPPATFVGFQVLGAIGGGLSAGLWVALMVAAAEGLTRQAFPRHHDWYAFVRHAGAPAVAGRVLGGYALAALGFLYVTLFYLGTRRFLGWWVPTGSLDDPNLIATPLPWVGALGTSLFAGIWEEAAFRAIPLALLSLWARDRPSRRWWMAAGVIVTSLVFGFGHANYPSWPAYSRGVELFAEAALWAVLYLVVGLPTTIVAHVLYDLTWFGLFALNGRGAAYTTTAAIVGLAFAVPALLVLAQWLRHRGRPADVDAAVPRLGDWRPAVEVEEEDEAPRPALAADVPDARRRWAAAAIAAGAAVLALALPPARVAGPPFTASRARVGLAADSALRARGVDPARWDRTLDTWAGVDGQLREFLKDSIGKARAVTFAQRWAGSYTLPAAWSARYVRRRGPLEQRAEEWNVTVRPDGQVHGVTHTLPDAAPGASPSPDSARALARAALVARGIDPGPLREQQLTRTPRPRRLDTTIEYADPAVALPGGASARLVVQVAGAEVVHVGRRVRLPEAWQRAQRERESTEGLVGMTAFVLFVALSIWLVLRALRRRRVLVPSALGPRGPVLLGLAVALAMLLPQLNGLPGQLAAWPTATPWDAFVAQLGVTQLLSASLFGAIAGGLWAAAEGMRRRAALPFWPRATDADLPGTAPRAATRAATDALLFGAALGCTPALLGSLLATRAAGEWPTPPGTVLPLLLPWAGHAAAPLMAGLMAPLLALLPAALVIAVRGVRARLGVAAVLALLLGATTPRDLSVGDSLAFALVTVAAVGALLWAFGRAHALAWVVAPIAGATVGLLRDARSGGTGHDVAAALLGAAVGAVLLLVLHRVAAARAARPADDVPAEAPADAAVSPAA